MKKKKNNAIFKISIFIFLLIVFVVLCFLFLTSNSTKSILNPLFSNDSEKYNTKLYLTPAATKYHYPEITQQKFMEWCSTRGVKYEKCECVLLHLQSFFSYEEMNEFNEKELLGFIENNKMVCNTE